MSPVAPRIDDQGRTQGWSYTVQYLSIMLKLVTNWGRGHLI